MPSPPTIVLYHDISDGNNILLNRLNVSTSPEIFEKHIAYFCQNYDVISIKDLISNKLPKKPLLITFDDAYKSVVDVAGPILKGNNCPSLFFINPSPISDKAIPIDNLISLAINILGPNSILDFIAPNENMSLTTGYIISTLLPRLDLPTRNALKKTLLNALDTEHNELMRQHPIYLSRSDFSTMERMNMAVGNHTYSHTHLRALTKSELNREIKVSKDKLEEYSNTPIDTLSIPYGNSTDASSSVLACARKSGHKITFLVHERINSLRPTPDVFFRTSLHNELVQSLPMKLHALPFLRTIKSIFRPQ